MSQLTNDVYLCSTATENVTTDDGGLTNAEAISISSVLATILGAQGLGSVKEICQDLLQLQYCLAEQEHYSRI